MIDIKIEMIKSSIIEFILIEKWHPELIYSNCIPRELFTKIASIIYSTISDNDSISNIEYKLSDFEKRILNIKSNQLANRQIASALSEISEPKNIMNFDIDYYLKEQEHNLEKLFVEKGRPLKYYFYEMQDMTATFSKIERNKIFEKSIYIKRWYEIILLGFPWINFTPEGYFEDGFIYCIEHNNNNYAVPMGLTAVLLPGLACNMNDEICLEFKKCISNE